MSLTVAFYRSAAGNEPVREWLKELNKSDRKSIGEDIKTVQIGWPLGMPLVEKMGTGLWEVRSNIKDGIARVLFTLSGSTMVLLHAFVKKSRKTPDKELVTANARRREVIKQ